MSEINSRPSNLNDGAKAALTDCFVTYLTFNENIVVQLTYPGTWSVSPDEPVNGYSVSTTTVLGVTTITFDFTQADYTQTADFTFTDLDDNLYVVTMGAPS